MSSGTFGARALEASSSAALLELESGEGRAGAFEAVDVVVAGVMVRALRGERVLRLFRSDRGDALTLVGIPDSLREALQAAFQLEVQQSRGAWFLPETVPIKGSSLLLPAFLREAPRYAHTLAAEEKGKVALEGNPDAMVVWSVLEPFADQLLAPIVMRVEEAGLLSREEHLSRSKQVAETYTELSLPVHDELRTFLWSGGWARLSAQEQVAVKSRFVGAISEHFDARVVRTHRAMVTRTLIAHYYSKAKKGRAKRRQVITKQHARTLAAFFGGDWLAFVRYLGEEPHEEERVVTALPEAKVLVAGRAKAVELASKKGIPIEEVERILETFWKDAGGQSPVLERVAAIAEYWSHFDQIHARQATGMPSLWGFVEDGGWVSFGDDGRGPYQASSYRKLLPDVLLAGIEQLWGTTVLSKWPDRVVSEPFPHTLMAKTIGPALAFWHGVALTAWFVCEGPYSRTDIRGLAEYYRRELLGLEDLGCPVDGRLFAELEAVPLGPEQPIYDNHQSMDVGFGFSIGIRSSSGTRRAGFERLRDVITHHRRNWTSVYLERYLRARWETTLKATARQHHLMSEERGKAPTLKQFAKHAIEPAQYWFGGDVSMLYASIGQKFGPDGVRRSLSMPRDRMTFATAVFATLRGSIVERSSVTSRNEDAQVRVDDVDRHHGLRRLALEGLTFVQLMEALGRAPTLKEFGAKFEWPSKVLSPDVDQAWAAFSRAVQTGLERS